MEAYIRGMKRTVVAVPEEVVRLRVNGSDVATWTCTPEALEALAVGRLLAMGFIRSAADIRAVDAGHEPGALTITVQLSADAAAAGAEELEHRRRHGCGLRFLIDCRPDLMPARSSHGTGWVGPPDADQFPALFRDLFERSPSRKEAGGHHTAALSDGETLVHVHEEVGRHNGADKVIGAALLAGLDPRPHGLLTTARISGEIAEKAARAGLAWVASRSVPTTLAVAIAAAAGLTLVGRAASPDARTFGPDAAVEP